MRSTLCVALGIAAVAGAIFAYGLLRAEADKGSPTHRLTKGGKPLAKISLIQAESPTRSCFAA